MAFVILHIIDTSFTLDENKLRCILKEGKTISINQGNNRLNDQKEILNQKSGQGTIFGRRSLIFIWKS